MDILNEWCLHQGLSVKPNKEVYFVNAQVLMKPLYKINNKIFVDIVEEREMNDKHYEYCRLFSLSFGTIIVIPKKSLNELQNYTKYDIEKRFNFKFNGNS